MRRNPNYVSLGRVVTSDQQIKVRSAHSSKPATSGAAFVTTCGPAPCTLRVAVEGFVWRLIFRPAGAYSFSAVHPRLAPWAAFCRRFAAFEGGCLSTFSAVLDRQRSRILRGLLNFHLSGSGLCISLRYHESSVQCSCCGGKKVISLPRGERRLTVPSYKTRVGTEVVTTFSSFQVP